jgi:hypothetical protein
MSTGNPAAFDPGEFTFVGKYVLKGQPLDVREARVRTSLGRAYYALFVSVRRAIATKAGKHVDHSIDHGQLQNLLMMGARQEKDPKNSGKLISLASLLSDLMTARLKADYALDPSTAWRTKLSDIGFARSQVDQARSAISQLPQIDLAAAARLM